MTGEKPMAITIEIDVADLRHYSSSFLATAWHVAQVNPAPFGDHRASDLVAKLGAEIIRRWLGGVEPELWHHQPRDHYWNELRRFATYKSGEPEFHDGVWVARTDDAEPPDSGRPLG